MSYRGGIEGGNTKDVRDVACAKEARQLEK